MRAADHPGVRFPPPLIFLAFILAGLALDALAGLPPLLLPGWLRWSIGFVAATTGLFLIASALALFHKAGTRPEPWQPSSALTTEGIYRRTRNPMYLGMACLHSAIAGGAASPGALLLLLPTLLIVDRSVIRREEAYLSRRFGQPYLDYKARVRRWLGRKRA